jgi:hypothetical protein
MPSQLAHTDPDAPTRFNRTSLEDTQRNGDGMSTGNKLLLIGLGIVVGVVIAKQIPQARRYLRLESM